MKHLTYVLAIVLVSCGQTPQATATPTIPMGAHYGVQNVDPAFTATLNTFINLAQDAMVAIPANRLNSLIIQFGNPGLVASLPPVTPGYSYSGVCQPRFENAYGTINYIITIDRALWMFGDKYWKQSALFHELGHCLLNREHTTVTLNSGDPGSIMNSIVPTSEQFKRNETTYIQELFTDLNSWDSGD